jgi:hypothetical protein
MKYVDSKFKYKKKMSSVFIDLNKAFHMFLKRQMLSKINESFKPSMYKVP